MSDDKPMENDVFLQRDGKMRKSPQEILEELKDMRIEYELELMDMEIVDGEVKMRKSRWHLEPFRRRFIADLTPNADAIDDDLVVNAAIYARYSTQLAAVERLYNRAKAIYDRTKGMVKIRIRETWNNPNIPLKDVTIDMIESLAICDKRVIVTQEIMRDIEEAKALLIGACTAMRMKHESCLEIARNRRGETRMIGTAPSTISSKDEVPTAGQITEQQILERMNKPRE